MRDPRAALLLVLAALCGGRIAAQAFPGEQAPQPAFPASLTLFAFGGFQANRVTRIYGPPDPLDAACDSIDCRTLHGLAKAPGLGVRFQFAATPRTGLRLGLSYENPHRRSETRDGSLTLNANERVQLVRAEFLLLFRLKRDVPVFFGLGGTATHYSPGPVRTQNAVTEIGGAFSVGVDGRVSPTVGTRVEFTGLVMKPTVGGGLSSEYHAHALAFDGQLSLGFTFLLAKRQ
ncbi:MAG TPA: hypothetical protein VNH63_09590 [Gemmatimonadales bacterium]|nr:hypothetical protein [Gemmatimonadales bacterium]